MARTQTRGELLEHFFEQAGFIYRSASAFDHGDFSEAKRLAAQIRTLVHDTKQSTSLLTSLGVLPHFPVYDTAEGGTRVGIPAWLHGMVMLRQSRDGRIAQYVPTLNQGPPGPQPRKRIFADWWNEPVWTHVPTGTTFSRREFVLALANKEGGSHVDPEISEKWASLTRDHAFDPFVSVIAGTDAVPFTGIGLAHVRQIAHEIWWTLREHPELGPIVDRLRPKSASTDHAR
jgi:hypothetical protein